LVGPVPTDNTGSKEADILPARGRIHNEPLNLTHPSGFTIEESD